MSSDDEATTPNEPNELETTTESDAIDAGEHVETAPEPAQRAAGTSPAPAPAAKRGIDARTLGLAGAIAVAIVLVFMGGLAIGTHHDGRGMHGNEWGPRGGMDGARGGGPGQGSGPQGERGMRGGFGMQGGPGGGGGQQGGGMPGARGGMPGGGDGPGGRRMHGGGLGIVEKASSSQLTIATLAGPDEQLKVTLNDDTQVLTRGDAGPQDLEEAEANDIEQGDIVMVHAARPTADSSSDDAASTKVTADAIIIVRAAND